MTTTVRHLATFVGVLSLAAINGGVPTEAIAELPKSSPEPSSPAPAPTIQSPTRIVLHQVMISSVVAENQASTNTNYANVTLVNNSASDVDVVLHVDAKLGYVDSKHPFHIPARGKVVDHLSVPWSTLCQTPFTMDLSLTAAAGVDIDPRVRHATHPTPTFAIGEIRLGAPGVPPAPEVLAKQVRFTSASVDGTYACGQKLKTKAHIQNGSGIVPQHLEVEMLDQAPAGAPPSVYPTGTFPKIGGVAVSVAATGGVDVVVTSDTTMIGRRGIVTLRLADSTDELGSKLSSYYKYASITVLDTTTGYWKVE